jgi:hypothetical protein
MPLTLACRNMPSPKVLLLDHRARLHPSGRHLGNPHCWPLDLVILDVASELLAQGGSHVDEG